MPYIHIKNIGPIVDTGVIALQTINILIGKQCTGKSTILKILSHCRWVEKQLCVGKPPKGRGVHYAYTHHYRFVHELIKFYRFDQSFFAQNSEIIYVGDTYRIEFKGSHNSNAAISQIKDSTPYNAKLSFIPSERNLISAIKDIESWYRSKDIDLLFNFIFEWDEVRDKFTASNPLSLMATPKLEYFYDKNKGEQLRIIGKGKDFSPFYASSGVQSALPMEVMVNALTDIVGTNANLSKSELMDIISAILKEGASFSKDSLEAKIAKEILVYRGAVFFIEEPEQNLFPESQAKMFRHFVAAINRANAKSEQPHSMLTLATHSPYILSAANVLMAASEAYAIDPDATIKIVAEEFILPHGSIAAYYVNEDGSVRSVIASDIYMIDGTYLDRASAAVEDTLDRLNDIICR